MAARLSCAVFVMLAIVISWNCNVLASDPDPLTDFNPNATTFVLKDVFTNGVVSEGPGGFRAALNTSIYPALVSQGITYVQFKMNPCGINLPHTHPRATEILTLVSGGPLQAGFVDTTGTSHISIIYPGDIIIFPRGLLHFELNVGDEMAFYISALNSQNPGVLSAAGVLLALPDRAAASALNQNLKTVRKLKREIYEYGDRLQLDTRAGCVPDKDITPDF